MLKHGTIQWEKSNVKDKKKDKSVKKDLEVECFKCGGKEHYAIECLSKKKGKKVIQVTWSDTESCQSSEKESNASDFTTFMESVIEEPLKKKVLSESCESSDSDGDEMSFDSTYETLYKECLSLKQE